MSGHDVTPGEAAVLNEQITAPNLSELPWQLSLGLVLVDEKPTLFALYSRTEPESSSPESPGYAAIGPAATGHVTAWVVALPDGAAVLLPTTGGAQARPILTTMHQIRRRWSRLMDAELVQVAGRQALHTAA